MQSGQLIAIFDDGSKSPLVLASGLSSPQALATDGTSVYFFDYPCCSGARLLKVPCAGGSVTVLATGLQAYNPNGLVVDNDSVYWTEGVAIKRLTPK
jgi:hypothetical protein